VLTDTPAQAHQRLQLVSQPGSLGYIPLRLLIARSVRVRLADTDQNSLIGVTAILTLKPREPAFGLLSENMTLAGLVRRERPAV
jgi:hypothetical protein